MAIEVSGLRKSYGAIEAVKGLSFEVRRGEVFGLLGPNGAGKTTTVEILEGYRARSGGSVRVLGQDPAIRDRRLQERVGIVLQSCGFHSHITVREAVRHMAKAYPRPREVDETIALVGLEDKADERSGHLSGGQRRRMDLALWPSSATRTWCSSTSPPPASTPPRDARRGLPWERSGTSGRPCCSPRTTWTRRRRWPTGWRSSRTAISWRRARPSELSPTSAGYRVSYVSDGRRVEHQTDDPTDLLHRLTGDAHRPRRDRSRASRWPVRRSKTCTWS